MTPPFRDARAMDEGGFDTTWLAEAGDGRFYLGLGCSGAL